MAPPVPLTPETDLTLLDRYIQRGDADAFAVLVQRHTDLVFHTCLRVLHDRAKAEDASQETFHRLMRSPESVSRSLPAWLHRAATNLAIDILRSDTARRERERSYQRLVEQRRGHPESWSELSGQVDEALTKLSETDRLLLVEHFYAGRTQQELAREHGVSKATMSRRVNAALEALRKKLRAGGVVVTVAALTSALTETAASAAPATLAAELGKMAMVSGTTAGGIGGATTPVAVLIALGTLGSTAVIGLFAAGLWLWSDAQRRVDVPHARPGVSAVAGALDPASEPVPLDSTGYIPVQPTDDRLSSDRIVMFRVQEGVATISYADSHVKSLPVEQARPLIEAQAGTTLETLVQRAEANTPPDGP